MTDNLWVQIISSIVFCGEDTAENNENNEYLLKYHFPKLREWTKQWKIRLATLISPIKFDTKGKIVLFFIIYNWDNIEEHFKYIDKTNPIYVFFYNFSEKNYPLLTEKMQNTPYSLVEIDNDNDQQATQHWKDFICARFQEHMTAQWQEQPTLLQIEDRYQEIFMMTYGVPFISRNKIYKALLKFIDKKHSQLLVITGEEGIGKSALLAKLCRAKTDAYHLLYHFISAGPYSEFIIVMLRRICLQLLQQNPRKVDIPTDLEQLSSVFKQLLKDVKHHTIVVIDGLERLEAKESARLLHWLPKKIPAKVQFIISSNSGLTFRNLIKYSDSEILKIPVFNDLEALHFMRYIAVESKKIKRCTKMYNHPLYLNFISQQWRLLQDPKAKLPSTIEDMFTYLLEDLEQQYGAEIVARLFCLLRCSHYGLKQQELEQMLVDVKGQEYINHILGQAKPYLSYREYSLKNFHRRKKITNYDYFEPSPILSQKWLIAVLQRCFRNVIYERYLDEEQSLSWLSFFIEYFEQQPDYIEENGVQRVNLRKLTELLWYKRKTKKFTEIFTTICSFSYMQAIPNLFQDFVYTIETMPPKSSYKIAPEVIVTRLMLGYIGGVVENCLRFLQIYPQCIFQVLWNNCYWHDCPEAHLGEKCNRALYPLFKDNKIYPLAQYWRSQKEKSEQLWVEKKIFIEDDSMGNVCFGKNGCMVVEVENALQIWNLKDLTLHHTIEMDPFTQIALSGNGKALVTTKTEPPYIYLWNTETGKREACFPMEEKIEKLILNERGNVLVVFTESGGFIYSFPSLELLYVIPSELDQFAISRCGNYIAYSCYLSTEKTELHVCKINRIELQTYVTEGSRLQHLCFSPNGELLVAQAVHEIREIGTWRESKRWRMNAWEINSGICQNTEWKICSGPGFVEGAEASHVKEPATVGFYHNNEEIWMKPYAGNKTYKWNIKDNNIETLERRLTLSLDPSFYSITEAYESTEYSQDGLSNEKKERYITTIYRNGEKIAYLPAKDDFILFPENTIALKRDKELSGYQIVQDQ